MRHWNIRKRRIQCPSIDNNVATLVTRSRHFPLFTADSLNGWRSPVFFSSSSRQTAITSSSLHPQLNFYGKIQGVFFINIITRSLRCILLGIIYYTGRFIMFFVITYIYNNINQRPYLDGIVHSHRKIEQVVFLTTRDVRFVHHGWHGTQGYDIQALATHASTWVHRYSSLLQWSVPGTDRCLVTRGALIERL
jgi:hypothetical protein